MKKIILSALLLLSLNSIAQTWVQVPDVNFQNYLTAHYPAAAFMTNGSDFFVDSDNSDIQAQYELNISGLSISNLSGIEAFTSLQNLDCSNNNLTGIAVLPPSLTQLNCSANAITALPSFPIGLYSLRCDNNQLISLPVLPPNLSFFWCFSNQLTALPDLPNSLDQLACMLNNLTELPALPPNLTVLQFGHNYIDSVPELPPNLINLDCSYNDSITSLPALPTSLVLLDCSMNAITSLPDLPDGLEGLSCALNQITEIPPVPAGLISLNCAGNQITALPALPSTLTSLACYHNPITEITYLPESLTFLDCNNIGLTSLPALPSGLVYFYCNLNQITDLGELPATLQVMNCAWNQLTSLNTLPDSLIQLNCSLNHISCLPLIPPSIQTIDLSDNPFTCLPNYIPAMDAATLVYPLCNETDPVNNPNGCQSAMGILGTVFKDVNNDCSDTTELLTYIPMNVNDNSGNLVTSSSSLANGEYYFAAGPGDYELEVNTVVLSPALQVTCPADNSLNAIVSAANPVDTAGNFGLNCIGFDLGVQSVVNYGTPFPGETHQLRVLAGDLTAQFHAYCAAGISGEVTIDVSGPGTVTFSGSPVVTGNTAVYSIADFGAVGANEFFASVLTSTNANSTNQFCVTVSVTTSASGDLNALNNAYSYCYHVVNSHDPNIKETYPESVNVGYTDEFTYTIHFQNTGNAPAINIRLADVLDHNLDLSTFKIVDASDEYTYSVNADSRLLSVRFPNIMLADSASDPQGSIGFIQYRIKPQGILPFGTVIENTCNIYFDYNSPITTNTTENVFTDLGFDELALNQLKLYPNPAKNVVTFESEESIEQMEFFNLNGTKVMTFKPNQTKTQVDVSALQNGVYIVKVQTKSGIVNKRLVVNQ